MIGVQSQAEPIPGYQLMERLGQGGFGEVWKARAPGGILKAIKIVHGCLHGNNEDDELYVRQELKALERVRGVRHPFILSLERYDIIDGQLFIVMELADCSLWDRYQQCRSQGLQGIPRDEMLRYMDETAEALDLMNREYQLQHLDIKPQNLFLLYSHIKVGDFGLVKGLEGMQAKVTSGVTPVYAAPETFEGVVSHFCDQYNLAIVYQELITGKLPFGGKTAQQLMMQHLTAAPNLEPLLPADRAAVARALSKKPEDRHPTCGDFVRALRQASGAVGAETFGRPTPVPAVNETAFLGSPGSAAAKKDPFGDVQSTTPLRLSPNHPPAADRERATLLYPLGNGAAERHAKPDAAATAKLPPERPEETGDGVLFPALVIGLGGVGLTILQQLRANLHKRVGPAENLPNIRFLEIDTDPETLAEAAQGVLEIQVREKEILLTRLQRPSHYLKPGHEQQALQSWFPLMKLKNLPRDQLTTEGWRALGRLGLATHYQAVAARLRTELDHCANPEALAEAKKRTGLGLRTTRPRVYIVAHLGGGTGSGMFLDVAHGVKRQLAQMGYQRAEVVGVFLLPAGNRQTSAQTAANAFAALCEMNHFCEGGSFSAGYPHFPEPNNERGPAFNRSFLLPMATDSGGAGPLQELTALAGDFLCRDLATGLGRTTDTSRTGADAHAMRLSSFGSYWFTVPHRLLLQRVAQRFCQSLLQAWQQEDQHAQETAKRAWIEQQFERGQLMPQALCQRLEEVCAETLGHTPQLACKALLEQWSTGGKKDLSRDPTAANSVFKDIEKFVGAPRDKAVTVLGQALDTAAKTISVDAHNRLAEIALAALAEPKFRFTSAGGDVIQRQLAEVLVELAKKHQELAEDQVRRAEHVAKGMRPLVETLRKRSFLGWGQKSRAAVELLDWLDDYLGIRSREMLYRQMSRFYQELHENMHKHQREVGCCWPRITQFLRSFEDAAAAGKSHVDLGLGQYLLPPGCKTLDEGAAQVLERLTVEETNTLHQRVLNLLARQLQEQVHVCTATAQFFKDLQDSVYREVASFTESQLTKAHAAEIYLQQHAADPAVLADLAGAFDESVPQLTSRSAAQEVAILAVPPGPEGEYFRGLVHQALPGQEFTIAASTDDIVFYREQLNLTLSDLPQLGANAQEAYERLLTGDHFTPHTRTDVLWRPALG